MKLRLFLSALTLTLTTSQAFSEVTDDSDLNHLPKSSKLHLIHRLTFKNGKAKLGNSCKLIAKADVNQLSDGIVESNVRYEVASVIQGPRPISLEGISFWSNDGYRFDSFRVFLKGSQFFDFIHCKSPTHSMSIREFQEHIRDYFEVEMNEIGNFMDGEPQAPNP